MSLVPRRGLLAISSVLDIALGAGERPTSARALAERYHLAPRHLEPILQKLVHVGILKGIRGPRGGYEMGRSPGEVTLDDILKAAVEPEEDASAPAFRKSTVIGQVVMPALDEAEDTMSRALRAVTIASMVNKARVEGFSPSE
jgi:Rrf2 family protein